LNTKTQSMNKWFLAILIFWNVQSIAQFATLTGGGQGFGPGGTVTYSVGQLVVTSTEDSEGSISPGVQQSHESNMVFINESGFDNSVSVFPNPVSDVIQMKFEKTFTGQILVSDANGRILVNQAVNDELIVIDSKHWNNGVYMLQTQTETNTFSIHKIIKK